MRSETISGGEERPGGEMGWPVFGLPPWKKYRRRDRAHLVPPNVGWMQQSPAVRRRAILPVGSTGGIGQVKRREFITLLGGVAAWPLAARAQEPSKLPTIGYFGAGAPSADTPWKAAFVQRLGELGWIEGRTIAIESRWAEGRSDRYAEIAAEMVRLKVAVIVTYGTAPVIAVKQATSVIPI